VQRSLRPRPRSRTVNQKTRPRTWSTGVEAAWRHSHGSRLQLWSKHPAQFCVFYSCLIFNFFCQSKLWWNVCWSVFSWPAKCTSSAGSRHYGHRWAIQQFGDVWLYSTWKALSSGGRIVWWWKDDGSSCTGVCHAVVRHFHFFTSTSSVLLWLFPTLSVNKMCKNFTGELGEIFLNLLQSL